MHTPRALTGLLAAAVAMSTMGCGPRVVTDITASPAHVKVTYVKRSFLFPETGIVECQRAEDGSLSGCQNLDITWRKPGN
jgi:hypothetical protein